LRIEGVSPQIHPASLRGYPFPIQIALILLRLSLDLFVILVGMNKQPSAYQSYLLRLWLAGEKEKTVWRASLESPHSGERTNFATLEELFGFLQRQTSPLADKNEDEKPLQNR
jgi:hypothetical protein